MKTQSRDTHPDAERVQIRLLRQKGPGGRFNLARSLTRTTLELAQRAFARLHPEATLPELRRRVVVQSYGHDVTACLGASHEERSLMPPDLLAALEPVCELFERLGVPHFVGGSLASSAHGIPRSTLDADLVAELTQEQVPLLVERLSEEYYVSEGMMRDAVRRCSSFNLIHLGTSLKVDVFVSGGHRLDRLAFERIQWHPLGNDPDSRRYPLAAPEDVVLRKLEWYRQGGEVSERQWNDVLGVLKVQAGVLDRAALRAGAAELGVSGLLERACRESG